MRTIDVVLLAPPWLTRVEAGGKTAYARVLEMGAIHSMYTGGLVGQLDQKMEGREKDKRCSRQREREKRERRGEEEEKLVEVMGD